MSEKTKRVTLTVSKVNLTSKVDGDGTLHKELTITAKVPFSQDRLEFLGANIGEPLAADLGPLQLGMGYGAPASDEDEDGE